ncbi:MAG: hypothetical protein ACRBN8_19895 [Nannocystales bacterium]
MSAYESWAQGWYGFDPESEDCAAWGPELTADEARVHPSSFPEEGAEERVRVFFISVSESKRHASWQEKALMCIWATGSDSEAARAFRGEGTLPGMRESSVGVAEAYALHNQRLQREVERLRKDAADRRFDDERLCEVFSEQMCGECHGCLLRENPEALYNDSETGAST